MGWQWWFGSKATEATVVAYDSTDLSVISFLCDDVIVFAFQCSPFAGFRCSRRRHPSTSTTKWTTSTQFFGRMKVSKIAVKNARRRRVTSAEVSGRKWRHWVRGYQSSSNITCSLSSSFDNPFFSVNPLMGTGNYSATSNNMKLVHWPLMGGLLHLVQRGTFSLKSLWVRSVVVDSMKSAPSDNLSLNTSKSNQIKSNLRNLP